MTAFSVPAWIALALAVVVTERIQGSRPTGSVSEPARLTDRLMVVSTLLAVCGGVIAPMIFPGTRIHGPWLPIAGFAFGLGGLVLRSSAMRRLGRHYSLTPNIEQRHALVTEGPYRYVRHPGYTGIVIQLLGLAALTGSFVSVLLVLPVAALVPLRVQVEERMLSEHFGAEYAAYARRTRHRFVAGLV